MSGFSNSNATREIPLHWQETLWWSWKKKDSLRQSSGERKYNYIYVAYKTCNAGIPSLFCLFTFPCLLGQSSSTFVTDQTVDSKSSTLQLGIWEFHHKFHLFRSVEYDSDCLFDTTSRWRPFDISRAHQSYLQQCMHNILLFKNQNLWNILQCLYLHLLEYNLVYFLGYTFCCRFKTQLYVHYM